MTIDDKHPLYTENLPDWQLMADVYAGQRIVKERRTKYLPPTPGMLADGFLHNDPEAVALYDAYLARAPFPEFTRETIGGLLGVIHRKPPTIEVPEAMLPMLGRATVWGESIELLWQRVTEAQLRDGRFGLAVDIPDGATGADAIPYVATYAATTIPNWDTRRQRDGREVAELVVLDESGWQRVKGLEWGQVYKYRVLALASAVRSAGVENLEAGDNEYVVGTLDLSASEDKADLTSATWVVPSLTSRKLERIPWAFVNPMDTTASPDVPPLLALANLALTIYRTEADYRQALHAIAQDTLVIKGRDKKQGGDVRVGAGAVIELPATGGAEFIGPNSQGIPALRQALQDDKAAASMYSVQMLDTEGGAAESGEALRVRVAARTATLHGLQRTAAAAIRDVLVHAGRWMGRPEAELDNITVEPNLDFSDATVEAAAVASLADAIMKGAPLSRRSFHGWLRKKEFTSFTFEEEQEEIAKEATDIPTGRTEVDIDPTGGNGAPPVPPPGDGKGQGAAA